MPPVGGRRLIFVYKSKMVVGYCPFGKTEQGSLFILWMLISWKTMVDRENVIADKSGISYYVLFVQFFLYVWKRNRQVTILYMSRDVSWIDNNNYNKTWLHKCEAALY